MAGVSLLLHATRLFALAALAAAAVPALQPPPPHSMIGWMGPLADRPMTNVTLPGTHDSGAFWLSRQLSPDSGGPLVDDLIKLAEDLGIPVWKLITPWALSGNLTFSQQLHRGVRYLDIRACYVNGTWYTMHFETGHTLKHLFGEIAAVLAAAPRTEVFVFEISHAGTPPAAAQAQLHRIITGSIGRYLFPRDSDRLGNLTEVTVGELARSGTPVVATLSLSKIVANETRLWPGDTIINSYADSANVTTMAAYNAEKTAEYTEAVAKAGGAAPFGDRLYKMSWTLTPTFATVVDSLLPGPQPHSLKDLAFIGNSLFPAFVAQQRSAGRAMGNIWIVDWFQHGSNIVKLFPLD